MVSLAVSDSERKPADPLITSIADDLGKAAQRQSEHRKTRRSQRTVQRCRLPSAGTPDWLSGALITFADAFSSSDLAVRYCHSGPVAS